MASAEITSSPPRFVLTEVLRDLMLTRIFSSRFALLLMVGFVFTPLTTGCGSSVESEPVGVEVENAEEEAMEDVDTSLEP